MSEIKIVLPSGNEMLAYFTAGYLSHRYGYWKRLREEVSLHGHERAFLFAMGCAAHDNDMLRLGLGQIFKRESELQKAILTVEWIRDNALYPQFAEPLRDAKGRRIMFLDEKPFYCEEMAK